MRVRVIEAVLEGGLQHEAGDAARNHRQAPLRQVGNIGRLSSFDPLLCEDTFLGELFDYVGNFESAVVPERAAEKLDVGSLATIVDLGQQHVAKLSKQAASVVLFQHRKTRRPFIDEIAQNLKIDPNQFVDAGLTHLDHHLAAVTK